MLSRILTIILLLNSSLAFAECSSCDYLQDLPSKSPSRLRMSDQCSMINVLSLCAKKLGACCVVTDTLTADTICTDNLLAQHACIDDLKLNTFCAQNANFNSLCTSQMNTNTLCAQVGQLNRACILEQRTNTLCADQISSRNLCLTGTLAGGFVNCGTYSSRAAVEANYTYTLGQPIDFTDIEYDPYGSIVQNPTRFIAPLSGTYMVTGQVVVDDLQGPSVITGIPVASVEIFINGTLRRGQFIPFLSFATNQSTYATSLVFMNQGDELEIKYEVFVIDPNAGFISYPGTVTVIGSPNIAQLRSFLFVHYLYSDCQSTCTPCDNVPPCTPCQPCTTQPCTPCSITPCAPCFPLCEPCCDRC